MRTITFSLFTFTFSLCVTAHASVYFLDGRVNISTTSGTMSTAADSLKLTVSRNGVTSSTMTIPSYDDVLSYGYFSAYYTFDLLKFYDETQKGALELNYSYSIWKGSQKETSEFSRKVGFAPYAIHAENAATLKATKVKCEQLTVVSNAIFQTAAITGRVQVAEKGLVVVTNTFDGAINSVVADQLVFMEGSVSNALLSKVGTLSAKYSEMTGASSFDYEINLDGRNYLSTAVAQGDEFYTNRLEVVRDGIAYITLFGRAVVDEDREIASAPQFTATVKLLAADNSTIAELGGKNYLVRGNDLTYADDGEPNSEGYVLTVPVRSGQYLEINSKAIRGKSSSGGTIECIGWAGVRMLSFGSKKN